ncbi:hypothetical protein Tco_0033740 [Tanacetum coccineum]
MVGVRLKNELNLKHLIQQGIHEDAGVSKVSTPMDSSMSASPVTTQQIGSSVVALFYHFMVVMVSDGIHSRYGVGSRSGGKFQAVQGCASWEPSRIKRDNEKNKNDADKWFAEILQLLKTRQPAATAAATTILPPLHTQPLQSYPIMLLQHPNTTTTSLPPTFALTQPLQQPGPTLPSFAKYTSFSGLPFDSQGFSIPYGSNGEFFRPFQTGEHSSHNCRLPGETQGCDDVPRGSSPVLVLMD